MNDVDVMSPRVVIPQVIPQETLQISSVALMFRLDSTAQEENETFTLSFTPPALSDPIIRRELQGVIIDATSKKHEPTFCCP